jgi:hypothetical protein
MMALVTLLAVAVDAAAEFLSHFLLLLLLLAVL